MEDIKSLEKAFINENSVLVQRMVAHITNPIDYIKLVACIPDNLDYVIVDMIIQLTVDFNFDKYYIWSLLNSKLINWYCYRFIYAKALRTMQFDNPVTSGIPIKLENEDLINKLRILFLFNY